MDSRLAILTDYVRQKNAAAASKLEPKQTWSSQSKASVISCPICIFILCLAVELVIQVVLYQITIFHQQLTHNMTTDFRPIYEDLQKLLRIGEPFWISEQFV